MSNLADGWHKSAIKNQSGENRIFASKREPLESKEPTVAKKVTLESEPSSGILQSTWEKSVPRRKNEINYWLVFLYVWEVLSVDQQSYRASIPKLVR